MKTIILTTPKSLFIFFLFFSLCFTKAQVVNIPDPNFKNALISIGVDTNNDGEIQLIEAQSLNFNLDLNDKNISDLTGIKSFTNVKSLYCGTNNLTTVDLNDMVNLQHVYLGYNNLTNININGMTDLRSFACTFNPLTSFNINGSPYLQSLTLSSNQFSSLHISNLPSLEIFQFENNNQSAILSFEALPNLKTIHADNSRLTSIDLNGLQTLKVLSCSNNQLNSLSFQDGFLQNLQALYVAGNPMQFICKDIYDLLPPTGNTAQLTGNCVLSTYETFNKQNKILIAPNPVKEYINLNQQVKQIKIFTTDGKLIFDKKENKNSKINISHLPSGVYILTTEIGNSKFIKE